MIYVVAQFYVYAGLLVSVLFVLSDRMMKMTRESTSRRRSGEPLTHTYVNFLSALITIINILIWPVLLMNLLMNLPRGDRP